MGGTFVLFANYFCTSIEVVGNEEFVPEIPVVLLQLSNYELGLENRIVDWFTGSFPKIIVVRFPRPKGKLD